MKAVIYARFSSENQREASLEDQERLCRQEADRNGYEVAHVYQDAALSGSLTDEQRPGLQAMLRDAEAKQFEVLIVDDLSRLSRDQVSALQILRRLEYWGVGFIARSDGIDTLRNVKTSRFLSGIKGVMAEEFLRELAEKTYRGLEGIARKGLNPGGLPYGYRSEPVTDERGEVIGHKRIVHDGEAEIVRRIFRMYVGEETGRPLSPREIAHRLNQEQIPSPGSRWKRNKRECASWSFTALIGHRKMSKGILHNRAYLGLMLWNRSQWQRHPDTKAFRYRVRPESEWIVRDDPSLRIISQALWDKAQARMAVLRTARIPTGPAARYLLSGVLKCGECGSAYIITNKRSYRCSAARNRGSTVCSNGHSIHRETIERAIIAAIREHLYTPETLTPLVEQVGALLRERARRDQREQAPTDTEGRLREVEQEIAHIKAAILVGKATKTLLEMLEERERERDTLRQHRVGPAPDIQDRFAAVLARLPEFDRRRSSGPGDADGLRHEPQPRRAGFAGVRGPVDAHPLDRPEAGGSRTPGGYVARTVLGGDPGAEDRQMEGGSLAGGGGFWSYPHDAQRWRSRDLRTVTRLPERRTSGLGSRS